MKKTMIIVLVVLLLLSAMSGCGRRGDAVEPVPGVDNNDSGVTPEDNNGVVNDGNGIIGDKPGATDTDVPEGGVLPEIGSDVEEGAEDIIDGVGEAIEGNDNNAAKPDTGAKNRSRIR